MAKVLSIKYIAVLFSGFAMFWQLAECSIMKCAFSTMCTRGTIGHLVDHVCPASRTTEGRGVFVDDCYPQTADNIFDNHFAWSLEPYCSAFVKSLDSRLCVYTDLNFAGGRGLSIITTPALASEFAKLPAFHTQSISRSSTVKEELPTEMAHLEERYFSATKKLSRGNLAVSDVPAIIGYYVVGMSLQEREELLQVAVSRLPVTTQKGISALRAQHGGSRYLRNGIVATNGGFTVDVAGHEHFSLFPRLSLLNHDCAPK